VHRGYSLCSPDLDEVLCLSGDKQSLFMSPITSTFVLNNALCLHDLTEAKNVLKRLNASEYTDVVKDVEIHNIARLYNKFF
jgi:hypothetical protein